MPGKSHGRRSLVGCSPWGRKESDMTERLHFHFSLSCIGEGNGNPLQYSCLENPRDVRAGCAAVYGVTQSRTRLKRLNSSSMFQKLCCTHIGSFIPLIALQDDILAQPADRKLRPRRNIHAQSCIASEQHSWGLNPDLCCTRAHALSSTSGHHHKA